MNFFLFFASTYTVYIDEEPCHKEFIYLKLSQHLFMFKNRLLQPWAMPMCCEVALLSPIADFFQVLYVVCGILLCLGVTAQAADSPIFIAMEAVCEYILVFVEFSTAEDDI